MIRLWWLGLIASSCGCGGGWSDADTKSAASAVKDELLIEAICAPEAGACTPSQVRALERAALCNSESMLFRHGKWVDLDAGGIVCRP